MTVKRLYRSNDDKLVAGILGGLASYVELDVVLVRLLYIAITIFTGVVPGIVVYILALFIVPRDPEARRVTYDVPNSKSEPEIR